jgi:phospholipase/carboxylesterase
MEQPNLPKNAGPVMWAGPSEKSCVESGLIHCIRLPKGASPDRPAPALVMLHGWRGDESSMWIFKQVIPAGVAAVTPRAPLELSAREYAWYRHNGARPAADPASLQEGLEYLVHFLHSLPELYPIDAERLILIGFSQGAAIGNGLALTRPEMIIGMASLAGLIPELPKQDIQTDDRLAGLPVFIAHGTEDPIVPLAEAQKTRELYIRLGADVTYGEYHTKHKMTVEAIKKLKAWVAGVLGKAGP